MNRIKKVTVESVILHSMRRMAYFLVSLLGILVLLFLCIETFRKLKSDMANEIATASNRISLSVNGYKNIVKDLGLQPAFSNKFVPLSYKETLLDRRCVEYNFSSGGIVNLDGFSEMDAFFRGDRQYFLKASKGEVVISDPIVSKEDNGLVVFVAAPVWKQGIVGGEILNVVYCSLNPNFLVEFLEKIPASKHSDAYILSSDGTVVGSLNEALVLSQNNNIKNAATQKQYRKIAKIETEILKDGMKPSFYFLGPVLNCFAAEKIDGTPDWKLVIRTPVYDYLFPFYIFFAYVVFIAIGCWFYAVVKSNKISKMISKPVQKIADRLRLAAEGDYTSEVVDVYKIEEIKMISEATQSLVSRMDTILNGADRYRETVSIENLIDGNDCLPLFEHYKKKYNVAVCIKDSQGNLLAGEEDLDSNTIYRERIVLNGRFVGFFEMSPKPGNKISEDAMKADIAVFSKVFENLIASNLRKTAQYKAWRGNEDANIKRFIGMTEEISADLHKWIEDIDELNEQGERKNLRQNIADFSARAKSALVTLDDTFEVIKFSDMRVTVEERDYSVIELVEFIGNRLSAQFQEDTIFLDLDDAQDMVRRLYGDFDGISRFVIRFVSCFSSKDPSKKIDLTFGTERKIYSCNLKITITLENGLLNHEEIEKIKEICKASTENFGEIEGKNASSMKSEMDDAANEISSIENYIYGFSKFYSVFKMAQLMNIRVSLKEKAGSVIIVTEIAQLEGGA